MLRVDIEQQSERQPLVTIGLPVYNGERFLDRALRSIREQDYPNLEIVISDNGSTDGTYAICQAHAAADSRIRLIRQSENKGAHANFEAVVHEARGVYFMWAADDDVWLPRFASRLVTELEAHPEAAAAMCATRRVHEDDSPLDEIRFLGRDDLAGMSAIGRGLAVLTPKKYNLFIYAVYRTELLRKGIAHFPRALGGDRMFVFQFALAAPLRYVDEVLYIRTHRPAHEASYLKASSNPIERMRQFYAFCRMVLQSSVIPSRTKLAFPQLALAYAAFLVRKEAYEVKTVLKSLLRRTFRGRLEVAAVVAALALALLGFILSTAAGGIANLVMGTPLIVLWAVFALFGAGLALTMAKILRQRQVLLTRMQRNHRTLTELVEGVGVDTNAARVGIKHLGAQLNDLTARQVELARRQGEIERYAKFSTDMLLAPPQVDPVVERESWPYGLNNQNTVRKQVLFARSLEQSRIRELYLQEIFPGIEAVSAPVGVINELTGHPNKVDMLYVCAIAKLKGARNIFEFGTYQGRTTYHLALASDETRVTTLDLPPDPNWAYSKYNGIYFRDKPVASRISQIYHDSRTLDTAPLARQFDFVFVDADHSYDGVKNDTEKAFELLKPGGIVMWHDYAPKSDGLVRFIQEFTQERPLFRIKRTCLLLHIDGVDPLTFEPLPMLAALELAHAATDPLQVEQIYHH